MRAEHRIDPSNKKKKHLQVCIHTYIHTHVQRNMIHLFDNRIRVRTHTDFSQ